MSAALRPATTAERAMGMARKRSVTPPGGVGGHGGAAMVDSTPNSMLRANMPGMRNSR
jgi:hypothetical protein